MPVMTFASRDSLLYSLLVCLLAAVPVRAQEPEPQPTQPPAQAQPPDQAQPAAPAPQPAPAPQTPAAPEPSGTGSTEGEGAITPQETPRFLSRLDIYFPEGD